MKIKRFVCKTTKSLILPLVVSPSAMKQSDAFFQFKISTFQKLIRFKSIQ